MFAIESNIINEESKAQKQYLFIVSAANLIVSQRGNSKIALTRIVCYKKDVFIKMKSNAECSRMNRRVGVTDVCAKSEQSLSFNSK